MLVRNKLFPPLKVSLRHFQYFFGVVRCITFTLFLLIVDQLLTNVSIAFHQVSVFSLVHCSE